MVKILIHLNIMLPNLPKQNKKKEADFGLTFRSWWKYNHHRIVSGSYELKDTRGKNYLLYSEVTDEQIKSGLANKSDIGNLIRVINGTIGTADYILLRNSYAYIVIKYPKKFCIIDIETFILEKHKNKRKSLTFERACEIAILVV